MAAAQIGTTLTVGALTITGSYIVVRRVTGNKEVDLEKVVDENGAYKTFVVFQKLATIELELICITGAAPLTDFPKGAMAAHADFTTYFVDDMSYEQSKSPARVRVKMTAIGI